MAVPDHSIDPRIFESARKEFLNNGFEKASLKAICEGAGVTTGALYKRYKGKEDLFCAVVDQTVKDLYEVAHSREIGIRPLCRTRNSSKPGTWTART